LKENRENRRKKISRSPVRLLIALLLAGSFAARSLTAAVQMVAPNLYQAGVYTVNFSTAQQKGTQWCWAACIEMILRYHGVSVTQEQVVQRIYGGLIDRPGNAQQILAALSGWGPNTQGGRSRIYAEGYPGLYPYFIQDLINGYPLIVGLNFSWGLNHAVILTAVTFSMDATGNYYPRSVVIRDPWPMNPERQEIDFGSFQQRCFFSARVAVMAN